MNRSVPQWGAVMSVLSTLCFVCLTSQVGAYPRSCPLYQIATVGSLPQEEQQGSTSLSVAGRPVSIKPLLAYLPQRLRAQVPTGIVFGDATGFTESIDSSLASGTSTQKQVDSRSKLLKQRLASFNRSVAGVALRAVDRPLLLYHRLPEYLRPFFAVGLRAKPGTRLCLNPAGRSLRTAFTVRSLLVAQRRLHERVAASSNKQFFTSHASRAAVGGNRDAVISGQERLTTFSFPKDLFIPQSVTTELFVGTLSGAASANVLKTGDTMTGDLVFDNQAGLIITDNQAAATVRVQAPDMITASYALTLPVSVGAAQSALYTTGGGDLGWKDLSSASGFVQDGGNVRGADLRVGTQDSYAVRLRTADTDRIILAADGQVQIAGPLAVSDRVTIAAGGIDVTGEVDIHGDIDFIGDLEVTGKLSSTDTLTVSGGGASITGPLAVSDRVTIAAGGIDVTGEVDIHGDIDFLGDLEVTGRLSSTDTLTVSGGGATIVGLVTLANQLTIQSGGLIVAGGGTFSQTVSAPGFVGNLTGLASGNVAKAGDQMTGSLTLLNQQPLILSDATATKSVSLSAPDALTSSYALSLPKAQGLDGYVLGLVNKETGELGWVDISNDSPLVQSGGNIVPAGDTLIMGALSDNSLAFVTNGVEQLSILPTGEAAFQGALQVGSGHIDLFAGSFTAPVISLIAPSALGNSYDLTLPISDGTAGQFLTTNGSGQLGWVSQELPQNLAYTDGNTVATSMKIGTKNGFGLSLQTNGSNRLSISSDGILTTHRPLWTEDTVLIKSNHELRLEDSGSRTVGLKAPAILDAAYTLTLPPDDGDAGEVLVTDGNGNLTWAVAPMPAGAVALGGNVVSSTMRVGTLNAQDLSLVSNGVARLTVPAEGVYASVVDPASALTLIMDNTGRIGTHVSSSRFKSGIVALGDEHDRFMQIRPVRYHLKPDTRKTPLYGFIAEELARVYPELVVYDAQGCPLGVKEYQLFGLLVNEVQRLSREVASLRAQLSPIL